MRDAASSSLSFQGAKGRSYRSCVKQILAIQDIAFRDRFAYIDMTKDRRERRIFFVYRGDPIWVVTWTSHGRWLRVGSVDRRPRHHWHSIRHWQRNFGRRFKSIIFTLVVVYIRELNKDITWINTDIWDNFKLKPKIRLGYRVVW